MEGERKQPSFFLFLAGLSRGKHDWGGGGEGLRYRRRAPAFLGASYRRLPRVSQSLNNTKCAGATVSRHSPKIQRQNPLQGSCPRASLRRPRRRCNNVAFWAQLSSQTGLGRCLRAAGSASGRLRGVLSREEEAEHERQSGRSWSRDCTSCKFARAYFTVLQGIGDRTSTSRTLRAWDSLNSAWGGMGARQRRARLGLSMGVRLQKSST